jgi:hypothetical protein
MLSIFAGSSGHQNAQIERPRLAIRVRQRSKPGPVNDQLMARPDAILINSAAIACKLQLLRRCVQECNPGGTKKIAGPKASGNLALARRAAIG